MDKQRQLHSISSSYCIVECECLFWWLPWKEIQFYTKKCKDGTAKEVMEVKGLVIVLTISALDYAIFKVESLLYCKLVHKIGIGVYFLQSIHINTNKFRQFSCCSIIWHYSNARNTYKSSGLYENISISWHLAHSISIVYP